MGILESTEIFQPVSHAPVHRGMPEKDEAGELQRLVSRIQARQVKKDSNAFMVHKIVTDRPYPVASKITDHADIRDQDPYQPPVPGIMQGRKEADAQQEHRCFFEFYQGSHMLYFDADTSCSGQPLRVLPDIVYAAGSVTGAGAFPLTSKSRMPLGSPCTSMSPLAISCLSRQSK